VCYERRSITSDEQKKTSTVVTLRSVRDGQDEVVNTCCAMPKKPGRRLRSPPLRPPRPSSAPLMERPESAKTKIARPRGRDVPSRQGGPAGQERERGALIRPMLGAPTRLRLFACR